MSDLSPLHTSIPPHQTIDVTLRDGGFTNGFNWQTETAALVVESALELGAAYCELGYVGGLPKEHGAEAWGPYAAITPDMITRLRMMAAGTALDGRLAVMVHPSASLTLGDSVFAPAMTAAPIDFASYRDAGVAMVRFVYHRDWAGRLFELHDQAKAAGLRTAINLALASHYKPVALRDEVEAIAKANPYILYLADTCGALLPDDVARLFSRIDYPRLGFHAHDYLSMAAANSLQAVTSGARFIDVSFLGLGRGAGNLRAELWAALLTRAGSLSPGIARAPKAIEALAAKSGIPTIPDWLALVAGAANLAPPQEDALRAAKQPLDDAISLLRRVAASAQEARS